MFKVVAITLYRRPYETRKLFEALANCHRIHDYNVLVSCDYLEEHSESCNEVLSLAYSFVDSHRGAVWQNKPRLGVDLNKLSVLPEAFLLSDYVVFLEDDTPPAQDALCYFEAMNQMFRDDKSVISISGYNRYLEQETHERVLANETYHLDRGQQFTPWGFGIWKDRYESIVGLDGEKYKKATGLDANGLFDHNMCRWMRENQPCYTVYPVLPRTNHVGGTNAEHTKDERWLMENEFAPFTAASQPMPDCTGVEWKPKWLQ